MRWSCCGAPLRRRLSGLASPDIRRIAELQALATLRGVVCGAPAPGGIEGVRCRRAPRPEKRRDDDGVCKGCPSGTRSGHTRPGSCARGGRRSKRGGGLHCGVQPRLSGLHSRGVGRAEGVPAALPRDREDSVRLPARVSRRLRVGQGSLPWRPASLQAGLSWAERFLSAGMRRRSRAVLRHRAYSGSDLSHGLQEERDRDPSPVPARLRARSRPLPGGGRR